MTRSGDAHRRDETRAFFGPRAAGWNDRFAEDGPAFAHAIGELGIRQGATVLDVGCGAGRALPDLDAAVGPDGLVLGVDVTDEMLREARRQPGHSPVVLADAGELPLRAGSCDVVFAAGLLSHLAHPQLGLVELARVTTNGGRLALFHPVGRAALAHKHGRARRPDDPLDPAQLPLLLAASGWHPDFIDDGPRRYLAVATRGP
jgi:SAM-dependent methyltransferase